MDNRVALIGIMVENPDSIETMNRILHEYGQYIIGRMGLPYRERGLSIISIVLDAPMNQISSLSGKLGMLDGISTKTIPARRLLIFRFRFAKHRSRNHQHCRRRYRNRLRGSFFRRNDCCQNRDLDRSPGGKL